MGNSFSNFFTQLKSIFLNKKCRIIMIGLDNAGKTTILMQLRYDKTVPTVPTMGFNVETVQYKNVSLVMWDVGGQEKIRHLWRIYSQEAQGVIFVVDCSDQARIAQAKGELHSIISQDCLKGAPLLVFGNKQDVVGSLDADQLKRELDLEAVVSRPWYIQPAVATKAEGLQEGLEWFVGHLKKSIF